jgi:hypothetical protein
MRSRVASIVECGAIVAVFAAAVALIGPRGNFPLCDDGRYAIPTFEFANTGEFHLPLDIAPSLRAQIVWGAAFVRLFGATYEALRLSSLVAAALALIVFNAILARTELSRPARVIATLALAFHPIFLWASCTFMTEVHFVLASVVAFALYARGLERDRARLLVAGGVAVAWSWWIRQTGIVNALPPLALLLVSRERLSTRWKRNAVLCCLPLVVFGAIYAIRPQWLVGSQQEFAGLWHMWTEETFRLPQQLALVESYFVLNLRACAVFFLPLAIALVPRAVSVRRVVMFMAAIIVAHAMLTSPDVMPFPNTLGNIFFNLGLGVPRIGDAGLHRAYPFALGATAHLLFAIAAGVITIAAVAGLTTALRERPLIARLALLHLLLGTAALCVSALWFDRYSLSSAWTFAIAAALSGEWTARTRALAIAAIVLIAIFDVAAVGEYFAWNRARWSAFNDLRQHGVAERDIGAGAEVIDVFELAHVTDWHQRRRIEALGSTGRRFILAFAPMPGYGLVKVTPFTGWFGLHRGNVLTLERTGR